MIAGSIAAAPVSPASCGLRLDDPGHPAVADGRLLYGAGGRRVSRG